MKPQTLIKQLSLLNRDLVSASSRMHKIANKLDIPQFEDLDKVILELEQLIKFAEEKSNATT